MSEPVDLREYVTAGDLDRVDAEPLPWRQRLRLWWFIRRIKRSPSVTVTFKYDDTKEPR